MVMFVTIVGAADDRVDLRVGQREKADLAARNQPVVPVMTANVGITNSSSGTNRARMALRASNGAARRVGPTTKPMNRSMPVDSLLDIT